MGAGVVFPPLCVLLSLFFFFCFLCLGGRYGTHNPKQMKTINPDIDIFNNLEKALKSFEKCETPCQLLEAKMGKKTDYFLDRSKEAIKEWPNLYKLISEK